jgi:uncharacterized protein (DUF983 family)
MRFSDTPVVSGWTPPCPRCGRSKLILVKDFSRPQTVFACRACGVTGKITEDRVRGFYFSVDQPKGPESYVKA